MQIYRSIKIEILAVLITLLFGIRVLFKTCLLYSDMSDVKLSQLIFVAKNFYLGIWPICYSPNTIRKKIVFSCIERS